MENLYTKETLLSQIKDMGFSEQQFNIAFQHSQNKSLEGLITWIDENSSLMEQELTKLTSEQQQPSNQQQQQQQQLSQQSQQQNPNPNQEEQKMDIEPANQNQQEPQQQQMTISSFVNQEFVKILQEMSYSKAVAEKALFMSGGQNVINQSVEKAIEWINDHKNDADFAEELFIVGQQEEKSKYTEEERKIKALELQERLRKQREEREKKLAIEQEQNRVKSGKMMSQAAREQEEAQIKRQMEEFKRQKQQDALDKQKMMDQLNKDKAERMGQKYIEQQKAAQNKPPIEKIEIGIQQMKKAQPDHLYPGIAKTALSTIKLYLENIAKQPSEEKFRKINLSNEKFQERVGKAFTGIAILKEVGFVEENGFLIMHNVNVQLIQQTIQKIATEL